MKKEVTPSLEGIFDGNSEDALTEYATMFNVKEMIEKVVHAHKEAKASLEGVLNYGEQSSMATEYDASFVAKAVTEVTAPNATEPEADASNVDTTAQQIEEASRTTTELASETPTTEAEATTKPVMVMNGVDNGIRPLLVPLMRSLVASAANLMFVTLRPPIAAMQIAATTNPPLAPAGSGSCSCSCSCSCSHLRLQCVPVCESYNLHMACHCWQEARRGEACCVRHDRWHYEFCTEG